MKPLSQFNEARIFLRKARIRIAYFFVPTLLAFLGSLFEGASVGLLVPLADGILKLDFGFVRNSAFGKGLLNRLPDFFSSNGAIFFMLLGTVFVATLAKNFLQYASVMTTSLIVRRFTNNLRQIIFGRYLEFGKLFFDRNSTGQLHHILMNFTHEVANRLKWTVQLLNAIFMLAVYLVIMIFISWQLAVFAWVLFPVIHYAVKWIIEKIKKTSDYYASLQKDLSKEIYNVLSCIPLVKLCSWEAKEKKNFAEVSSMIEGIEVSLDKKYEFIYPLQEIITITALLLLISVMGMMVSGANQVHSVAKFLVFFYVIRRSTGSFGAINQFLSNWAMVKGHLTAIFEMMQDEDKHFVSSGREIFEKFTTAIEFSHLTFSYCPGQPVLHDVTARIEKGEMTAIVGPSGVGKTTLVNLIMRFYEIPPGSLFIDGTDIRAFDVASLHSKMAMVSQDTLLFNSTIRENLVYGMNDVMSDERLVDVTRKARLYDFIRTLPDQFDTVIGDRGIMLSGGEKQRLSIARAMLKKAEILILDEATSSLDSKTETLIQQAIEELIEGKTAIVIAHRLSTIKHADKIIVLEDGKIMEQGSRDGLLNARGRFYQYWQDQKFH